MLTVGERIENRRDLLKRQALNVIDLPPESPEALAAQESVERLESALARAEGELAEVVVDTERARQTLHDLERSRLLSEPTPNIDTARIEAERLTSHQARLETLVAELSADLEEQIKASTSALDSIKEAIAHERLCTLAAEQEKTTRKLVKASRDVAKSISEIQLAAREQDLIAPATGASSGYQDRVAHVVSQMMYAILWQIGESRLITRGILPNDTLRDLNMQDAIDAMRWVCQQPDSIETND